MFKKKKHFSLWWTVFRGKGNDVYKKIPYNYILPLQEVVFYGERFLIPDRINAYLSHRYGDWRKKVHRSNYSCYTTDLSIVDSFEKI